MTFKRIVVKIHLWLGLTSGLVVFILGITGCFWSFKEEIRYIVNRVDNESLLETRDFSESFAAAQKAIGGDNIIDYVWLYNDTTRTSVFFSWEENEEYDGMWHFGQVPYAHAAYVNLNNSNVERLIDQRFEFVT